MKYHIKTTPKKAISVLRIIKAAKNSNKMEVRTKPILKLQAEVLNDLMVGFLKEIENVKKEIG